MRVFDEEQRRRRRPRCDGLDAIQAGSLYPNALAARNRNRNLTIRLERSLIAASRYTLEVIEMVRSSLPEAWVPKMKHFRAPLPYFDQHATLRDRHCSEGRFRLARVVVVRSHQ